MKQRTGRKLLSFLFTLAMVNGLMMGGLPVPGTITIVHAETYSPQPRYIQNKASQTRLGTGEINDGCLVHYGKYDGTEPTQYYVLDNNSADFGVEGGSLFLDCNSVLSENAVFDEDGQPNERADKVCDWRYSDLNKNLNESLFLTKEGNLTLVEAGAIAESRKSKRAAEDQPVEGSVFAPLTGEKIFALDDSEFYRYFPRGHKKSSGSNWWVRSYDAYNGNDFWLREENGDIVRKGDVPGNKMAEGGVSPAFNVKRSSIFSSVCTYIISNKESASGTKHKLTLLDSSIKVEAGPGKAGGKKNSSLYNDIPYTVSGNFNGLFLLLLDHKYIPGESLDNTRFYYIAPPLITTGSGSAGTARAPFASSDFHQKIWGTDYYAYLVAEMVHSENNTLNNETDYAGFPYEIAVASYPTITKQPEALNVVYGNEVSAALTVGVSAPPNHTLSYQWYINTVSSNNGGDPIDGAVSENYVIPPTKSAGIEEYYYCTVTATAKAASTGYTATAEVKSDPAKVTVSPKEAVIAADDKSKAYGENDPALTATVTGEVNGDSLNYTLKRGEGETIGKYDIIVTVGENPNYTVTTENGVFTINKLEWRVTAPKAKEGLVCNDTAQKLVVAGSAEGGEMSYALGNDNKTAPTTGWITSIPTATNAGTYYVWYRVKGDSIHNEVAPECAGASVINNPESGPTQPTEPEPGPAQPTEPEPGPTQPTEPESDPKQPTEPESGPTQPTEPELGPTQPTEPELGPKPGQSPEPGPNPEPTPSPSPEPSPMPEPDPSPSSSPEPGSAPTPVPQSEPERVPFTEPGQVYASPEDNFAPIAVGASEGVGGDIKDLILDFTGVKKSGVDPSELRMTAIKGSRFTTAAKVSDRGSIKATGGVKARYNKKDSTATFTCKKGGTATVTMEDGDTYTISFTVEKPKVQAAAKKMAAGGAAVTRTVADLFGTRINSGKLTIEKQKHSQAKADGDTVIIDPKEKDSIKIIYQYLNRKYKITIKVK